MTRGRGSTRAWRKLRAEILARDPLCQMRLPGCTGISVEVDHIRNLARGGSDHSSNLRGVCASCHEAKSLVEAVEGRSLRRLSRTFEAHPGRLGGGIPKPTQDGHRNV